MYFTAESNAISHVQLSKRTHAWTRIEKHNIPNVLMTKFSKKQKR